MASREVERGKLTYRPLDQHRREIRLVELRSDFSAGDNGDQLPSLRMRHVFFDLGNPPQYWALSYTWGSRPQKTVLVQDEDRSAQEVFVSANLADFLHEATLHSKSNANHVYWIDQLCINQDDDAEKSHQVQMMRDIFSQAELTIVWLGSQGLTLSSEELKSFAKLSETIDSDVETQLRDNGCRALESECRPTKLVSMLHRAKNTAEMTVNESRRPIKSTCLTNIIRHMMWNGQTKATRPEDLVYSVLGIVSDGDACGIEIDYSKHYTTVYAKVALLFLKTLGAYGLALSGQLGRGGDDDGFWLPSWIPDLRLDSAHTFHHWPSAYSSTSRMFSATMHSLFEYSVDEKCEVLSVHTLHVDSVVEVSTIFDFADLDSDDRVAESSAKQTWLKTFAHFLQASLERYPQRYDHPAREEMLWRIPVADWHWDGVMGVGRRAVPEDKRGYTAVLNSDSGLVDSGLGNHPAYLDNLQLFGNICFVTKSGFIGLGHPDTVVGDEIHLIQGSDTPFVLRNTAGHYELVSETYVHGIMDGELFDDRVKFEEVQIH
ncbi:MAG: hypothetical protein Q9212_004661 [Teloschistes hypoglaucus]